MLVEAIDDEVLLLGALVFALVALLVWTSCTTPSRAPPR
jgi:hypothetical protein